MSSGKSHSEFNFKFQIPATNFLKFFFFNVDNFFKVFIEFVTILLLASVFFSATRHVAP